MTTDEELKDAFPENVYPDAELPFLIWHYTKRLEMLKAEQERRSREK